MQLSLIGMAGSGKTYWSIKLAEQGFKHFCCDDLIAKKLASELIRPDGTTTEVGEWMGFPYESRYKECESRYLVYETGTVMEILNYIENLEKDSEMNIVIDTTGSIIYTGEEILRKLRHYTKVIYLLTPLELYDQMLKSYMDKPRAILWRDIFNKLPHETNESALARCYPRLLFSRQQLYERYADITIDYYRYREEEFGINDLTRIVNDMESKKHSPK